ncbi:hypothetical protein HaLaN_26986 [Haematococcus lacustris]|uniref:Uncharacterized protein n=1 Tax=Haematococcus lacustris TaxID=44745 RepID=A0A6A0A7E4_HAELA|nr:hypothetical protein HaLaN_26986 [Haematococcus lacustris]
MSMVGMSGVSMGVNPKDNAIGQGKDARGTPLASMKEGARSHWCQDTAEGGKVDFSPSLAGQAAEPHAAAGRRGLTSWSSVYATKIDGTFFRAILPDLVGPDHWPRKCETVWGANLRVARDNVLTGQFCTTSSLR